MKKHIVFLLVLALSVGIAGCKANTQQKAEETQAATTEATAVATMASVAPTEIPTVETSEVSTQAPTDATVVSTELTVAPTEATTEEPTQAPTEEPHSDFYVAGVSEDEIISYFNKTVLEMTNTTGNNEASLVRKWDHPVIYRIDGAPAQQDGQTINRLTKQLNAVEGFPGIQASTGLEHNVVITFLRETEYKTQFSHLFDGEMPDSVMQYWHYDENNSIYYGRIGYNKDASQEVRDVVVPKELMNLLGISDITPREDDPEDENKTGKSSNKKDEEIKVLSDIDLAVFKLLYNTQIHCGMNAAECERIIRELYY